MSPLTFLDASTPGTGGWIETPNQRLGIQHILPISTPEQLSKITVEDSSLRLGDVARVVEDHQPLIGDALIDDEPALMLVVEKFPWANTVQVTQATEKALAALQLGMPGVKVESSLYRPATYLELVRKNLGSGLTIAMVLAAAGLFALFLEWRAALIATVALLSSALVALFVLYLQAVTINSMVIAGLVMALAALVDDAVVDVQSIRRRLAAGASGASAIFEGALRMRGPALYATVILLLCAAPAYFLPSVAGGFARPIVLAYGLALLASLAVAMTVTPALCLLLLGDSRSASRQSPLLAALRAPFEALLGSALRAPGKPFSLGVGALGAVVLVGLVAFPRSGSVIPDFRERDILITLDAAPGTSELAMAGIASRATRDLRGIPGVQNVSAHLGRAVMSDRVSDVNSGELWVSIDVAADYDATVAAIREAASHYPGLDIDVQTYLNERIREETEDDEVLTVRVYGEDMDEIRSKAEEVQKMLLLVDGVVDPEVQYPELHPELQVEVDLARSKQYGIKPGDVRRAAATLLSGIHVGSLFEAQKVFDVVVWGKPEIRHSMTDVENLLIDSPAGGHVRLGDVANVRVASAPRVIERESVARHIDVTSGVSGDIAAISDDIESRLRRIQFPLEMRAEVKENYAAEASGKRRVAGFAVAAAIGTVLLLQAAFGSWSLAGLFFLALPVALLGGVAVAALGGGLASLGSILGLGAVLGLAVRNGVTTIRHYRDLQREEKAGVTADLVRRGTQDRLPPILMSAVVTALIVLPFAFLGNVAGHEILHPLALATLGGLVSATLVNVLVVPALYLAYGAGAETFELEAEEEAAA
jgi:Cu/Ag efflux pump CusA